MTISAKTGSRRRLLESPRARGDRPSIRRLFPILRASQYGNVPPKSSKFLIANARLEIRATRTKQSAATKSNRERIAILQSGFSGPVTGSHLINAFQGVGALAPTYSAQKTVGFSPWGNSLSCLGHIHQTDRCTLAFSPSGTEMPLAQQFLIATDDQTRIGILSDQRESKELSSDPAKIQRTAEAPATFLIATVTQSEFESTHCKHTTKRNSNRNKTAISGISVAVSMHPCLPAPFASPVPPCLHASLHPSLVAATRAARYNSGSHIEVNQP
jgi:hypothetical protein